MNNDIHIDVKYYIPKNDPVWVAEQKVRKAHEKRHDELMARQLKATIEKWAIIEGRKL